VVVLCVTSSAAATSSSSSLVQKLWRIRISCGSHWKRPMKFEPETPATDFPRFAASEK
jgi:hypothetical protein